MNTDLSSEDIAIVKAIIELNDLYDQTWDIKPNVVRNVIQDRIRTMIAELGTEIQVQLTN